MCLHPSQEHSRKYYQKNYQKQKKVIVWKILMVDNGEMTTPYFRQAVSFGNVLGTPEDKFSHIPYNLLYVGHNQQYYLFPRRIEGGVIHVFLHRKNARRDVRALNGDYLQKHFVVRCEANINDFVACDSEEAAFTKIKVGYNEKR